MPERALRSPAQFDMAKLTNMNALYIAELPEEEFRRAMGFLDMVVDASQGGGGEDWLRPYVEVYRQVRREWLRAHPES